MRERVENDLFGIADRLRSIDASYFILRTDSGFEVHNAAQRGSTFALRVPYPELDERTVTLVRRTRRERMEQLLKETEAENAALERRRQDEVMRAAAERTERLLAGRKEEES